MKDFRDLKVWEKAHGLALDCYSLTANFPKHEIFGIVSQIRRAGSSIGANIAEGCGRGGNAEFQRFLQMAMGSPANWNTIGCLLEICILSTSKPTTKFNRKSLKLKRC